METEFSDKNTNLIEFNTQHLFRKPRVETTYTFDYEVNNVQISTIDNKQVLIDKKTKNVVELNEINDSINNVDKDGPAKAIGTKRYNANCIKRLVSKKKHRVQNEYYDLDMAYITQRVMAMGYPSTGCESIYRNKLNDIIGFLNRYHRDYKVYNLCMESGRIYSKEYFNGKKVALFPFLDHEPCPIKLMLEFCTDLVLYLLSSDGGVAAVHCKAGKGRTGVMIISYLIFSGLCENSAQAARHYGKQRTDNNKGVTIASQLRYVEYFETFLSSNFVKPFYKRIPKIMELHINTEVVNIMRTYLTDNSYFYTDNKFLLKHLKIGPFNVKKDYKVTMTSIIYQHINFANMNKVINIDSSNGKYYIDIDFNSSELFNYDIRMQCGESKFKFYTWVNLWYSTLENLSHYIIENDLINLSSPVPLQQLANQNKNTNDDNNEMIFNEGNSSSQIELKSFTDEISSTSPIKRKRKTRNSAIAVDMMKQIEQLELSIDNFGDIDDGDNSYDNIINYNQNSTERIEETITTSSSSPKMSHQKEVKRRNTFKRTNIGKLIDALCKTRDLIQFTNGVNKISEKLGINQFEMSNQKIVLLKDNLDKFEDAFSFADNTNDQFKVEFTYALVNQDNNNII